MLIAPAKKDNNNATPHYMYNLRESPSPSLHRPHFIGGRRDKQGIPFNGDAA